MRARIDATTTRLHVPGPGARRRSACASAAGANARSTRPRSRMSQASTCGGPSRLAATASSRPRSRARSVTAAPSAASRCGTARPMPVPAPVTATCFPVMLSPEICNLREKRVKRPLISTVYRILSPLRRARDATRTKPHREAVRGSGRSPGVVDESAPGSANSWSDVQSTRSGLQQTSLFTERSQFAGFSVEARLTQAIFVPRVADAPSTERPRLRGSSKGNRASGGRSEGSDGGDTDSVHFLCANSAGAVTRADNPAAPCRANILRQNS